LKPWIFPTVKFLGAYPIGDTKIEELPVREIPPAIGFYKEVLVTYTLFAIFHPFATSIESCTQGFSVVEFDTKTAKLQRGDAKIGLQVNKEDPEQASVYFSVLNIRQLRREYEDCGICPSQLSEEIVDNNDKIVRFFVKEPYGVCFCFGQKIRESRVMKVVDGSAGQERPESEDEKKPEKK